MKVLLTTLGALAAASFAAAAGPLETVEAYIDAHNRHDVEAVLNLFAPGIVFVMPNGDTRDGLEQMANLEAWDAALESRLDVSDLEVVGTSVVAGEIVEHNLWFELSGIGPITYLPGAVYEVEDGRITSIHAASWEPEHIVAFTNFLNRFVPWATAAFPSETAAAMPDGGFRYDADAAQMWIEMLVAWKDSLTGGGDG